MKILIAPDSFKGTLTAPQAAEAIRRGVMTAMPDAETVLLPVGDGGEGTAETIASALPGCERITCPTADPLGRPITASYIIKDGVTALIESAAAGGLTLVAPGERDIMKADTTGTGLLIADAYGRGIRDFIICLGGTATCDGGYGAFEVLRAHNIRNAAFTLLSDVDNPFCGPQGAARVFAPQKGARPEQIPLLERRLEELARHYGSIGGSDVSEAKYAGAAGGLAGMLMACFGATPMAGISKVLELLDFDRHLEGADLVITGEGSADATTLSGKAAKGILDAARRRGVPTLLLAGRVSGRDALLQAGFADAVGATPEGADNVTLEENAAFYLEQAAGRYLGNFS